MARTPATQGLLARAFDAAARAVAPIARRSADGFDLSGTRRRFPSAYHAASPGPYVPVVPDLGPFDGVRYMRPCQRLVLHQYRNDNLIKSLVEKTGELMIPGAPVPVSKFPELDDLWMMASEQFDARGNQSFGAWLRDDVFRDMTIYGEAFIRRRGRNVRRGRDGSLIPERGLMVPMQWQSLPSTYLPTGDLYAEAPDRGNVVISGIEFDPIEARVAYHPYTRNPVGSQKGGVPLTQTRVVADEFHHLFIPAQTGAPRPEVPLAAAILIALKNHEVLDANVRQMVLSQCFSVMIEEDLPDGDDAPDEEEIQEALRGLTLTPGGITRLPTGLKAKSMNPPLNPNFQQLVRTNILYMCAGLGTPIHEVTNDYDTITERAMRFAGLGTRRRGDIVHDRLEHQGINPMRRAFVDGVMAIGLWTPPPGRPAWEAYQCDWQWPQIMTTQMTQEISGLAKAVEMGALDIDTVTTTTFGMRPEVRDRKAAKAAARAATLGLVAGSARGTFETPVAKRVLAEAEAEETRERDIVEASSREDSAIDLDEA